MRVLISGGCKMGKSTLAQRVVVAQAGQPVYVATMRPRDAEDEARIARHRREREGMGFATIERATDIASGLADVPPDSSILLDSTTALLAEEMFPAGKTPDPLAAERVLADVLAVLDRFERIVIVSDAIYADGGRYDEWTEAYRRGLARIDRALAARCDAVVEMVVGQRIMHKGALPDGC